MKKIGKIILIIGLIACMFLGIYFITRYFINEKNRQASPETVASDKTDETVITSIQNSFTDGPSDITGMTKSQKVEAGLNPADGSDTDFDGLTDKEEIETYKSDPLKESTAGDLYTDGYKASHGMDLHKKYDYDGDVTHTVEGVTLTAVSPFDFGATVARCTESIGKYKEYESERNVQYNNVYEIFKISNYSNNTFSIDTSAAIKASLSDEDNVSLLIFKNYDTEPLSDVNVSKNDNILTVTLGENMEPMSVYTLFLYNDKGVVGNFISTVEADASEALEKKSEEDAEIEEDFQSLITLWPYTCLFFGFKPRIYISNTATEQQIEDTLKMADTMYHESEPSMGNKDEMKRHFTIDDCEITSNTAIRAKTELLYSIWGAKHIYIGFMSDQMAIRCYSPYGAYSKAFNLEREEEKELAKKFIGSDRFCFSNFKTDYYTENHGVCAGYAWLVGLIHDNDGLKSLSGSYYSDTYDKNVEYSMDVNSPDNLTLLDRYVSDYKAYKFKVLSIDEMNNPNCFDGNINEDEKEFTKMVSAYWAKYNDNLSKNDIALVGFISNKSQNYLSWETIENMKNALDANKILTWSFVLNNKYGNGHTVNLIGYDTYDNDGTNDTVVFDVYDSNYPEETFKLECKKIISSRGDESFTYKYVTGVKGDYTSSFDFTKSDNEKGPYDQYKEGDTLHLFHVMDSELNCLNVPLDLTK